MVVAFRRGGEDGENLHKDWENKKRKVSGVGAR